MPLFLERAAASFKTNVVRCFLDVPVSGQSNNVGEKKKDSKVYSLLLIEFNNIQNSNSKNRLTIIQLRN